MEQCTAVAKDTGERCRRWAVRAGRCSLHDSGEPPAPITIPGRALIRKFLQLRKKRPPCGLTRSQRALFFRRRDRSMGLVLGKLAMQYGQHYRFEDLRTMLGFDSFTMRRFINYYYGLLRPLREKFGHGWGRKVVYKKGRKKVPDDVLRKYVMKNKHKSWDDIARDLGLRSVKHTISRATGLGIRKPPAARTPRPSFRKPDEETHRLVMAEMDRIEGELTRLVQAVPYDPDAFARFSSRLRRIVAMYESFRYAYYARRGGWEEARERLGRKYVPSKRNTMRAASLWRRLAHSSSLKDPDVPLGDILSGKREFAWWRDTITGPKTSARTSWCDLPNIDVRYIEVAFFFFASVSTIVRWLKMASDTGWSIGELRARMAAAKSEERQRLQQ